MRRGFRQLGPAPRGAWKKNVGSSLLLGASLAVVLTSQSSGAMTAEYAKPISNRLNVTGKAIIYSVPLRDNGAVAGEVVVRIAPDDSVSVSAHSLLEVLGGNCREQTRAHIAELASANGYLALPHLAEAGLEAHFDNGAQELMIAIGPEQRPTGDLNFGARQSGRVNSASVSAASYSGYLNMIAGIDHDWGGDQVAGSASPTTSGHFEFESALRAWNTVLENRALYTGNVDPNICPIGAVCAYRHEEGFKRQMSRLVYDRPDDLIRVEAGDVDPIGLGVQRTPDIIGLSIEKSSRKLAPGRATAAAPTSTLRLERQSVVEVVINGALIQRLQLRAGTYQLRDLPLATGVNDIEFIITDDAGNTIRRNLHSLYDLSILESGSSDWGITVGMPSYLRDDERRYNENNIVASGFAVYGLTDAVTGESHLQGDKTVASSIRRLGGFSPSAAPHRRENSAPAWRATLAGSSAIFQGFCLDTARAYILGLIIGVQIFIVLARFCWLNVGSHFRSMIISYVSKRPTMRRSLWIRR